MSVNLTADEAYAACLTSMDFYFKNEKASCLRKFLTEFPPRGARIRR